MKIYTQTIFSLMLGIGCSFGLSGQTLSRLGSLEHYTVISDRAIENTGTTTISGDVEALLNITGFTNAPDNSGPGIIKNGELINGISFSGVNSIYQDLAAEVCQPENDLSGKILGKDILSLKPGIYNFKNNAQLSGTLRLNDGGNKNALYIFQVNESLITSAMSRIVMSSGGPGHNIFWEVTDAKIGAGTIFTGNIISKFGITLSNKASTTGKLWSVFGIVSLNNNNIAMVNDADGDGVPDNSDDYPKDATRAYNNYTNPFLIYYDGAWVNSFDPNVSDKSMSYSYNIITNAHHEIVQIVGSLKAISKDGRIKNMNGADFSLPASPVKLTGERSSKYTWHTVNYYNDWYLNTVYGYDNHQSI